MLGLAHLGREEMFFLASASLRGNQFGPRSFILHQVLPIEGRTADVLLPVG
jgi:hypothetical protein